MGQGDFTIMSDFDGTSVSGIVDVFDPQNFEDHVMHGGASIEQDYWLGRYDEKVFPLNPEDEDTIPIGVGLDKYRRGGSGLYCGSCHNVHKQPVSNGDYLRTKKDESVGLPGLRRDFCVQCHDSETTTEKNRHLDNTRCLTCHHPHKGSELLAEDEEIGRSIFVFEVTPVDFIALPNVPKINDKEDDMLIFSSSKCYACHQPNHLKDIEDPYVFLKAGAAPIYGDYMADKNGEKRDCQNRAEHHPMGDQARLKGDYFPRARGAAATQNLNSKGELTCVSCHADVHGGTNADTSVWSYTESKRNNFLRWDFKNDNARFCLECHPSKEILVEGSEDVKHFWENSSRIKRKVFESEKFNIDNPQQY